MRLSSDRRAQRLEPSQSLARRLTRRLISIARGLNIRTYAKMGLQNNIKIFCYLYSLRLSRELQSRPLQAQCGLAKDPRFPK
jgi:hypothetical protein